MSRPFRQFARRLLRLVTHNFLWKMVALAGAVVIWALVASEPELSTFDTVPLEFRNLPPGIEISSQPRESVTLEIRGPAGELRGSNENRRPAVVLDMADAMPGERTYAVSGSAVSLPRGVRLVLAFPSEVRFNFDRELTRKIPVEVRFMKENSGYQVTSYSVTPDMLDIEGPASHVERVASVSTDPLPIPSAPGSARFRVNAYLTDSYVRFAQSPQVEVTVVTRKQGRG
jgi:YbbR domain-containing protein